MKIKHVCLLAHNLYETFVTTRSTFDNNVQCSTVQCVHIQSIDRKNGEECGNSFQPLYVGRHEHS